MSSHKLTKQASVLEDILEDDGLQVEFWYDYLKGDPGCRTLRNGDPGWPPSPPEVTLNSVWLYHESTPNKRVDIYPILDGKSEEVIVTRIYEEHDDEMDEGC